MSTNQRFLKSPRKEQHKKDFPNLDFFPNFCIPNLFRFEKNLFFFTKFKLRLKNNQKVVFFMSLLIADFVFGFFWAIRIHFLSAICYAMVMLATSPIIFIFFFLPSTVWLFILFIKFSSGRETASSSNYGNLNSESNNKKTSKQYFTSFIVDLFLILQAIVSISMIYATFFASIAFIDTSKLILGSLCVFFGQFVSQNISLFIGEFFFIFFKFFHLMGMSVCEFVATAILSIWAIFELFVLVWVLAERMPDSKDFAKSFATFTQGNEDEGDKLVLRLPESQNDNVVDMGKEKYEQKFAHTIPDEQSNDESQSLLKK